MSASDTVSYTVVPLAERITLTDVFAHASLPMQVLLTGLLAATLAAVVVWFLQLGKLSRRRSDGVAGAIAYLSALAASAPLIGLFGVGWAMLACSIGIANVRPTPTLTVLAPAFAEASLSICLGLLAAAVAAIAHRHLKARIFGIELADLAPAPQAA
jgi:biopolymer transport protein ExbB/TolQ